MLISHGREFRGRRFAAEPVELHRLEGRGLAWRCVGSRETGRMESYRGANVFAGSVKAMPWTARRTYRLGPRQGAVSKACRPVRVRGETVAPNTSGYEIWSGTSRIAGARAQLNHDVPAPWKELEPSSSMAIWSSSCTLKREPRTSTKCSSTTWCFTPARIAE